MTTDLSHIKHTPRLVVLHAPEDQEHLTTFTHALREQPRASSLHIIPLCRGARVLGLQSTITNFMLSQADAVVFLSAPRDREQLEQIRLAKSARGGEGAVILEANDRQPSGLQQLAGRLMDRLFPPKIQQVLCLFACPDELEPLALGREWREIEEVNNRAGKPLALEACWAARVRDLQDALLAPRRDLLHFAGHGVPGRVYFETSDGGSHTVATGKLIRQLAEHRPQCLVFNACHSADMLATVRDRVPHVIAMQGPTSDGGSIAFSRDFYAALAHGWMVERAFEHAFGGLGLHGHAEQCRPQLLN
jgi:hypothetical protein